MNKTIYFLDKSTDIDDINFNNINNEDTKIFSLDHFIHKKLEEKKINHIIGENFLDKETRNKIYEKVVEVHKWYDDYNKNFDFNGINLLSMLDTNEFHTYVIQRLIQFQIIRNILVKEKPKKIFSTKNLQSILNLLEISQFSLLNETVDKEKLAWDEFNIILKVNRFQLPIKISRKKYQNFKNIFEKIIGNIFGLWLNPKTNSKIILFLEFNPADYDDLICHLKKHDYCPTFLNFRRSAIWNWKSINTLRRNHGKIINEHKFIDSKRKESLEKTHQEFSKKLDEFWKTEDGIAKKFVFEGVPFWLAIKDMLKKSYENRLYEYLKLITLSKSFFEILNIHCTVSLNEVGETEKAILNVSNNQKSSILLEHGFANYIPEISKFDSLSYYHLLRDKIAVWGDIQKTYLINVKNIPNEKILVIGSPKHDYFFKNNLKQDIIKDKKTILLTTHPIIDLVGRGGTLAHQKFEKFLINLINVKKTFQNVELIVKLHPSPDPQHEYTKKFLQELDPTIKVFQSASIIDLIRISDVMINVSEFYSPSTAVMEAMILSKPIIYISLYEKEIPFEFITKNAVLSIDTESELEESIHTVLYDEQKRKELLINSQNFLKNYLNSPGHSSEKFAKILASIDSDLTS